MAFDTHFSEDPEGNTEVTVICTECWQEISLCSWEADYTFKIDIFSALHKDCRDGKK